MKLYFKALVVLMLLSIGRVEGFSQSDGQSVRQRAANGEVDAMHTLGMEYKNKQMADSAKYWFTKAAEKGYMFSQSCLGQMLEQQEEPDYKGALYWYEKAAENGYNWAEYKVGHFYVHGIGTEANDKIAEKWLKKAAEKGACFGLPQYEYGKYYAKGMKAKEWLLKSAEAGFPEALTEIARKYRGGPFKHDPDSVFHYFNLAANEGDANGQFNLSEYYVSGDYCKQSYRKALELFREAEEGHSSDLLLYKKLYSNPDMNNAYEFDSINNVLNYKDDASKYWYREVAFNDDAVSKYRLFYCYYAGKFGVAHDDDEEVYWLYEAAVSDILEAQVITAKVYENRGDLENAAYWYQRGCDSKKYMVDETTEEKRQEMKDQCKAALERLGKQKR